MNAFALRLAEVDDAAEIARLSGELGYPVDAAAVTRNLAQLLPLPTHRIWVAAGADGLLGWTSAERRVLVESGERVELVALVVDARVRRGGIGQAGAGGRRLDAAAGFAHAGGALERRADRIASVLREARLRADEDAAQLQQDPISLLPRRHRFEPSAPTSSGERVG